ncbi:MAG: dimethyl sulfoxide reductase anchor subunit, partial [Rhodospirillaceae bacterium]|nr:dimethyl sulfoxide reductase anchor subunit [Rhodospirillaceae bacterium]
AWRAFSQWRSSWLSREGILAVATFVPAGLTALGWVFFEEIWQVPALLLTALALATICATAMIYASLKTVRRWRNGWTLPGYLVMGFGSGSLWLCLLCALFRINAGPLLWLALIFLSLAGLAKLGYWRFVDQETGTATAGSATGLGRFGKVKLFAAPHTEENYLLKEMGFKIARKHAVKLRRIALLLGWAAPVLALLIAARLPEIIALLPIPIAAVGGAGGVKALFVTGGVNYAAVGAAGKAKNLVTIGSDPACVKSGACVMGVSTDPKV